ncbi:hypothetical protein OG470_36625 [Micromonospora sp. NBC_00389]|uniref:hypothetical protein n=1 Tax=Micromonospora sp. NBC_00389 TaxID=2903586 RepID=UPI002E1E8C9A
MPARRNPKKSRTPAPTPPGTDPAAGRGSLPLPLTRPDLPPVEPALPAMLVGSALPTAPAGPVDLLPLADVPTATEVPAGIEVPPVVNVPAVVDLPAAERPAAPTAGPPQGGGPRSAGGRSQRAGQPRRYAFRRS